MAAEIRYGKIGQEQEALTQLQQQLEASKTEDTLIKEEVSYEDIAEVIEKWTGIPASKLVASKNF